MSCLSYDVELGPSGTTRRQSRFHCAFVKLLSGWHRFSWWRSGHNNLCKHHRRPAHAPKRIRSLKHQWFIQPRRINRMPCSLLVTSCKAECQELSRRRAEEAGNAKHSFSRPLSCTQVKRSLGFAEGTAKLAQRLRQTAGCLSTLPMCVLPITHWCSTSKTMHDSSCWQAANYCRQAA